MMFYVLLSACLLLGLGIVSAAAYRPDTRRRGARLLACIAAVAALWFLAYPPQRTISVPRSEAILLTAGYSPDTLRALLRHLGPATRVWQYAPDSAQTTSETASVARLGTLREQLPALRYLHLLGTGLPSAVLPELGPMKLLWHPPAATAGFQAASWNHRLELGHPLLVEGSYHSPTRAPVWVRLQAAGTTHDSIRLPAGRGSFRLRYTPKNAGRLVATLSAGPTKQLLATEPVPTEVLPTRPLRVLLLGATPSFELKFLRNHLASRQHAVAWRTGISRGLTQTEFSNQPATDLSRLTPALLSRYDVVVADAPFLSGLGGAEAQILRSAQRATGLGLVVLAEANTPPRSLGGATTMRVLSQPAAADRPQRLAWPAAKALVSATLQLSSPARPLVAATSPARAVVAAQRLGAGTVVVSVLPETYPWLLQNETATYAAYWSRLLSAAARPVAAATEWLATEPWPRAGLPVALQVAGAANATRPLLVSGATGVALTRLPLRQDALLPEWHTATYWPTQVGWQQLERPGQAAQWLYVFGSQDWQGPEALRRVAASRPWRAAAGTAVAPAQMQVPWPASWFVALFVVAAGFLWLEEKL